MTAQGWSGGVSFQCQPGAPMHSFVHSISRCEPSLTRLGGAEGCACCSAGTGGRVAAKRQVGLCVVDYRLS